MKHKDFKLIGDSNGQFILFISPVDYFGSNGTKQYVKTLREAINIIDDKINTDMFVRLQRVNKSKRYWRVLLRPENKEGIREIDGTNWIEMTDRVFRSFTAK